MRPLYGTRHRVIDAAVRDDCFSWVKCAFDVFPHWTGGRCEQKNRLLQGAVGGRVRIYCGRRRAPSCTHWLLHFRFRTRPRSHLPTHRPSHRGPSIAQLPCATRGRSQNTAEFQLSLNSLHAMDIPADRPGARRKEASSHRLCSAART